MATMRRPWSWRNAARERSGSRLEMGCPGDNCCAHAGTGRTVGNADINALLDFVAGARSVLVPSERLALVLARALIFGFVGMTQ